MARMLSHNNKILARYESGTYGSASGLGHWIGYVQNHEPNDEETVQTLRNLGSDDRDVDTFQNTVKRYSGKITMFPSNWIMLGMALGSMVDSGSPSPYTHTLSAINGNNSYAFTSGPDNPFASFTLESSKKAVGTGLNSVRTYNGVVVDNFTLSLDKGGIANAEVDYIAQSMVWSSGNTTALSGTPSIVGYNRPFMWRDFVVHIPSGTTIPEIQSLRFKVGNKFMAEPEINGSATIAVPQPTERDYEFEITAAATSERMKTFKENYFLGGSTFNAMLYQNVAQITGSRTMALVMSGCKVTEMTDPDPLEGVNEYTLMIKPATVNVPDIQDEIQLYNPW